MDPSSDSGLDASGEPPEDVSGTDDPAEEALQPGRRRWLIGLAIAAIAGIAIAGAVWAQGGDDSAGEDSTETVAREGDGDEGESSPDPDPPDADEPATEDPLDGGTDKDATDGPVEVASGSFVSLDYEVTGEAKVLQQPDGTHLVRLEELASDDGPDLYVYLSRNPSDGPKDAFKDDFVDLGSLQDTTGTQDYEVPAGVEPTGFASVVIWCEAVSAPFGAADL